MNLSATHLSFDRGSLVLSTEKIPPDLESHFTWDTRTLQWRAPASAYREVMTHAQQKKLTLSDGARAYDKMDVSIRKDFAPRTHQEAALKAWIAAGRRGVVQMPTGSGKTFLAMMAIAHLKRPTLILVPTIDLVLQWQRTLASMLVDAAGVPTTIGALGGGEHNLQPITISTYDSALIWLEKIGDRFGFLIADECHHLPAPQYQSIAIGTIAPFRLGLSATVARADGGEEIIFKLLGPLAFDTQIRDLETQILSPYDVVTIDVYLTDDERERYQAARSVYTAFIRQHHIRFDAGGGGWSEFVWRSAKFPGGRAAMRAYRMQKRLAQAASQKLERCWEILYRHRDDRVIIFTDDNALAYQVGRRFMLPVLTHQTKMAERKKMLAAFSSGELPVLVTSKVLNEGVDVPEASVGVVMSGSAGVREHVQRLGRILRHVPGKRAVMYEMISQATSEESVQQRRRQHDAYERAH